MRLLLLFCCLLCCAATRGQQYYLYAGTYTHKAGKPSGSKGIYVYRFNDSTGQLTWLSNTAKGTVKNPSYLAIAASGKHLYACTNTRMEREGSISAYAISDTSGALKLMNSQPSGGANPVYLALHNSGRWLVNANYTSGSVSLFPINSNGSVAPLAQLVQHTGNSRDEARQASPHVHATVFAPSYKYLYVPDLGTDRIYCYKFTDTAARPLQPAWPAYSKAVWGSGPRHMVFQPGGGHAWCIEELGGTISGFTSHDSMLLPLQRIKSYKDIEQEYNSADIHVSPDGKFLYASNRNKENNIAIFSIDEHGKLLPAGHVATEGNEPRNFIITPSGNYLLVANQVTGNIVVFSRDKKTGMIQKTNNTVALPEPSCLQLLQIK